MGKENVYTSSGSDHRVFFLSDRIDNESVGKLCFDIINILEKDDEEEIEKKSFTRKPIKLYINSGGGEAHDMWAVIDILLHSKTPVHTYVTGYAMSAALKIFLAGSKRYVSKHSTLLYHQMWVERGGLYQDLVDVRPEVDRMQNEIEQYVLERTNVTEQKLKEIREKKVDWFIHCNEALEYGFATNIIE